MIRNYFSVLIRSLKKRKFYSFINILCLAAAITFALLIGMFIQGEMKVNSSLHDVGRLFLVESKTASSTAPDFFAPARLLSQAVEQYPAVFQSRYRFLDRSITLSVGEKHFRLQSMVGDPSFMTMFGFKTISGNVEQAFRNPNSLVVTAKTARLFFGRTNVAGETMIVSTEQNGKKQYEITAVIADPDEKNSVTDFMNMNAQVFLSFENSKDFFPNFERESWEDFVIPYVRLSRTATQAEAEALLNRIVAESAPENNDEPRTYLLSPLEDYYRLSNNGAVQKLILSLMVIAFLILALAVSNFINIAIATAFSRLKEVGVRKVIGSLRRQIITQFLFEACAIASISGFLALFFYEVLRPYVGQLFGSDLPSLLHFHAATWMMVVVCVLVIGLLAGFYPAIFQSMTKTVDSLKGKFKSVKGTMQLSRLLIGVQFLITVFIFITAVIVSRQVAYFLEKDLGYNGAHVLVVNSVPRLWNDAGFSKMEAAKKEFLRSPVIKSVSLSWGSPDGNFIPGGSMVHKAGSSAERAIAHVITCGDEDYRDVFGLKLVEGSFLDEGGLRQRNAVIINETAKKALDARVGDQLRAVDYGDTVFVVKGVVADFNYQSLHQNISPVMIMHPLDFRAYRYFNFKIAGDDLATSVKEVERMWKNVFPDEPFDYWFADERMRAMYTTELQMKKASATATVLMMIIVFTGILGLVSLSVSRRTKEIGIRKVLGASVRDILQLVSREYVWLTLVSSIAAIPVAYTLAQRWLNSFAYRIELEWWMFGLPGLLLLAFTWTIVAIQFYGTAADNPVRSLKHE